MPREHIHLAVELVFVGNRFWNVSTCDPPDRRRRSEAVSPPSRGCHVASKVKPAPACTAKASGSSPRLRRLKGKFALVVKATGRGGFDSARVVPCLFRPGVLLRQGARLRFHARAEREEVGVAKWTLLEGGTRILVQGSTYVVRSVVRGNRGKIETAETCSRSVRGREEIALIVTAALRRHHGAGEGIQPPGFSSQRASQRRKCGRCCPIERTDQPLIAIAQHLPATLSVSGNSCALPNSSQAGADQSVIPSAPSTPGKSGRSELISANPASGRKLKPQCCLTVRRCAVAAGTHCHPSAH